MFPFVVCIYCCTAQQYIPLLTPQDKFFDSRPIYAYRTISRHLSTRIGSSIDIDCCVEFRKVLVSLLSCTTSPTVFLSLLKPSLLAVPVSLEIFQASVPVITVAVHTLHRCLRCSSTRINELGSYMSSLKLLLVVQRLRVLFWGL